ncbi:MAG: GNAT family N-acetyltransferase [Anaerolineae bacterium]
MREEIEIRPARAEDREPVLAFCQHTFEWGDYIGQVWDRWLTDPQGKMFVATLADRPIGICHVALLSSREAWLEGARVDPGHRRQGVATALTLRCLEYARQEGRQVALLATEAENHAARGAVEGLGFRPRTTFAYCVAGPDAAQVREVRAADAGDLGVMRAIWDNSPIRRAATGLFPRTWRWREMTWRDVEAAVAAGEALIHPAGFALGGQGYGDSLEVYWLDGRPEALGPLALALRRRAHDLGLAKAEAMVPNYPPLLEALARAGYEKEMDMLAYEKEM